MIVEEELDIKRGRSSVVVVFVVLKTKKGERYELDFIVMVFIVLIRNALVRVKLINVPQQKKIE